MQIELLIGNRIRKFRKARRLKLEELANASGISKALLSKIENAKVGSPISTYSKISAALGIRLSDLFQEDRKRGSCVVIPKRERKFVSTEQAVHGYHFESLGHKWHNTNLNPFVLTYLPQAKNSPSPNFTFEGEEFIFILEGELEIFYGGKIYHLGPGDCIFLDARVPHGGRAGGNKKAVALLISIPQEMLPETH
jgi:transcriptional regulator with XRE-family HTH domain